MGCGLGFGVRTSVFCFLLSSSAPIEGGHGSICLAFDGLLFQVMAFVDSGLTSANPNLHLHEAVLPVKPEGDQGLAFNCARRKQLTNLGLVQQKLPGTLWLMLYMAGALVRLDIRIVQKYLAVFDSSESIAQVRQAGSDRFDFGAAEFDSRLYPVDNLVVVERSAI